MYVQIQLVTRQAQVIVPLQACKVPTEKSNGGAAGAAAAQELQQRQPRLPPNLQQPPLPPLVWPFRGC